MVDEVHKRVIGSTILSMLNPIYYLKGVESGHSWQIHKCRCWQQLKKLQKGLSSYKENPKSVQIAGTFNPLPKWNENVQPCQPQHQCHTENCPDTSATIWIYKSLRVLLWKERVLYITSSISVQRQNKLTIRHFNPMADILNNRKSAHKSWNIGWEFICFSMLNSLNFFFSLPPDMFWNFRKVSMDQRQPGNDPKTTP